jgi:hypothetical protein
MTRHPGGTTLEDVSWRIRGTRTWELVSRVAIANLSSFLQSPVWYQISFNKLQKMLCFSSLVSLTDFIFILII